MRQRVYKKKLNRDTAQRKALLKSLSASLINNLTITTTVAKAKYVKPYVEKLITTAKKQNGYITVQQARKNLCDEGATKKLINEIAPKLADRKGGYTRITRLGNRDGDKAPTAKIEIIMPSVKQKAVKGNTKKAIKGEAVNE